MNPSNPKFILGNREISENHPPLVIAEVGINHEGSLKKAKAMVDTAVEAGCECIKFQCHITEKEMIPTDMTPGEISKDKLWDIIKRCELTADEERELKNYCDQKGIMFLSTPFSREACDQLEKLNVPGYKIGSGECNNYPLVDHIASKGKPIILSTGMNNIESVRKSVEIIQKRGCPLILMHCTSMYPTPYKMVRLGGIPDLQKAFGVPVGLSDHSIGVYTCLGAVALGAVVLEKHYTNTREWPGPDISISIEPHELKELVIGSKAIFEARGGGKTILPDEQPVIDFAYASVVSTAPIQKGEVFSKANTWVKRPGTGKLLADRLEEVWGKEALRSFDAEEQISPEDVNWN